MPAWCHLRPCSHSPAGPTPTPGLGVGGLTVICDAHGPSRSPFLWRPWLSAGSAPSGPSHCGRCWAHSPHGVPLPGWQVQAGAALGGWACLSPGPAPRGDTAFCRASRPSPCPWSSLQLVGPKPSMASPCPAQLRPSVLPGKCENCAAPAKPPEAGLKALLWGLPATWTFLCSQRGSQG